MNSQYVVQEDEGCWVAGTRVALDSIAYAFLSGQTAENIAPSTWSKSRVLRVNSFFIE